MAETVTSDTAWQHDAESRPTVNSSATCRCAVTNAPASGLPNSNQATASKWRAGRGEIQGRPILALCDKLCRAHRRERKRVDALGTGGSRHAPRLAGCDLPATSVRYLTVYQRRKNIGPPPRARGRGRAAAAPDHDRFVSDQRGLPRRQPPRDARRRRPPAAFSLSSPLTVLPPAVLLVPRPCVGDVAARNIDDLEPDQIRTPSARRAALELGASYICYVEHRAEYLRSSAPMSR